MKAKRIILASAIGLALYYLVLRGARAIEVQVRSIAFNAINILNALVYLTVNLTVNNPLLVGVTIRRIAGDIYVNGQLAGKVDHVMNYYLSGVMSSTVPVQVAVSVNNLTQVLIDALNNGDYSSVTIAFNGSVYCGDLNIAIPVQFEKQLEA